MPQSKHFPKFKEALPDVTGKVFAITGTTSGTGFVAAKTVAEKGGIVLCLNRKSKRVTEAYAKLQVAVPKATFVNIECDLQDFESVSKAAEDIKAKYSSIYCLSCNAGISMSEDKATKDGCDLQMQTNHLSHFILAAKLYPLLEKSAAEDGDARVVFHSSGARHMTKNAGLEELYFDKNGGNLGGNGSSLFFGGGRHDRYAQSKLANSVMMHAMHEKLQAKNSKVKVTAAHPGGCATNLGDGVFETMPWIDRQILSVLFRFFFQSVEDGTMGLLRGTMATDAVSGELYGPKGNPIAGEAVLNPPQKYENDPVAMKMLWESSEAATGVKFEI